MPEILRIKYVLICLLPLIIISCYAEVDIDENKEPIIKEISIPTNAINLQYQELDVFFYKTFNQETDRFIGLKDGIDFEIPISINSEFEIPEDNVKFFGYAEWYMSINERYDLVRGGFTKVLNPFEIIRNDTIFSIAGFEHQTRGDFVLFDKQTFKFIELDEHFHAYHLLHRPVHVVNNKMYYIVNPPTNSSSAIRFIDLNNIDLPSQTLYESDNIIKFLINDQMDLFLYRGINNSFQNFYVNSSSGDVMQPPFQDVFLKNHFVGVDGQFYAQHIWTNLEQEARGFYSIDVFDNSVNITEVYDKDDEGIPFSFLGKSHIIIPNIAQNKNIIIDSNNGASTMSPYEFDAVNGNVNPLDIEINGLLFADYFQDDYLVIADFYESGMNSRLRKYDLSSMNKVAEVDLGTNPSHCTINKNNGSVFCLSSYDNTSKLFELKIDNSIIEIDLDFHQEGFFALP